MHAKHNNYHLPYGTDIIEAEQVAAEGARLAWERGSKVIVLPCISFLAWTLAGGMM